MLQRLLLLHGWHNLVQVALRSAKSAHVRHAQVGRAGGLLLGMQCCPGLALRPLFENAADKAALGATVDRCEQATSYAVAYQPENQDAYGGVGRVGWGSRWGCAMAVESGVARAQPAIPARVPLRPERTWAGPRAGRGVFTAAVELSQQQTLSISFLHHMTVGVPAPPACCSATAALGTLQGGQITAAWR